MKYAVMGVLAVCAAVAFGGEVDDVRRFVAQFEQLDRLRFDGEIRTVMLVPEGAGSVTRMESAGAYHYAFDAGRFVVESNIVSKDPSHAFLDRVSLYAYTGDAYVFYDAGMDAHESFAQPPERVGVFVSMNPLVLPIGFLRCDLGSFELMGLEHFDDEADGEAIEENIEQMRVVRDARGQVCVEITLDPERDQRGGAEVERYRVYLHKAGAFGAGFGLPRRIEMRDGSGSPGEIVIGGYASVRTGTGVVYLPSEVTYKVRMQGEGAGDATEVKSNARLRSFSTGELPASAFRPDMPGVEIRVSKDEGILWDGKPSACSVGSGGE